MQVIEELLQSLIQVVSRYEVIINWGISRIGRLNRLILLVDREREVVWQRNVFYIERLLQMFKIFDRIMENQFIL